MSVPKLTVLLGIVLFTLSVSVKAQDSTKLDRLISLPDRIFSSLDKKTKNIEDKFDHQTTKYLTSFRKQENRLKKKLWKKDSLLAKQLFPPELNAKYEQLKAAPATLNKISSVYSGHLDSLNTAFSFLKSSNTSNPQVDKLLGEYKSLQGKMNVSDQVQKYLQERQSLLKSEFQKLGMVKELKKFRAQVYYYQAQVKEYKERFEDPDKMERKVLQLVMQVPQFKEFFARNSTLSSLFALPGAGADPSVSLQGLQTRAMMNQTIADRFGSSANITQLLQQNVQSAQGQLSELKNQLSRYSSGSYGNSGDVDLPTGFKPNTQKTRSFFKRLELGTNIQSQKARMFFPVTSDLGLSIGYKVNDKSVVGVGASGKVGWGSGWNRIELSYQGLSLRSYLDYQLKSSLFISGGYEMNYRSMIHSIQQLKDYPLWQRSGLIGLSKRYHVSKKVKGEMKVLWDFMSYQQVPKTQPVLFRIGYTFK
jgi:hypothetical protein